MSIFASVKESMQNFAIQQALEYIEGNPEENIPKLMELSDRLIPSAWFGRPEGLFVSLFSRKITGIS